MLIVHQRKKPARQIGAGFPLMLLGDGTDEGVLNKVVGSASVIPVQCECISPKPRNLLFEQL
jgi:hypothetical protein